MNRRTHIAARRGGPTLPLQQQRLQRTVTPTRCYRAQLQQNTLLLFFFLMLYKKNQQLVGIYLSRHHDLLLVLSHMGVGRLRAFTNNVRPILIPVNRLSP